MSPLPPPACPQKLIRYMTQGIDMSAAFVPATKWVLASARLDARLCRQQLCTACHHAHTD